MKNIEAELGVGDIVEHRGIFWIIESIDPRAEKWPFTLVGLGSAREALAAERELTKVKLESSYDANVKALMQVEESIESKEQELAALKTSRIALTTQIVAQAWDKDKD